MVTHASPPRFIAVGPGVGFRLPVFCTSLDRVLLAALPDDALDAYLERLESPALAIKTPTDLRLVRGSTLKADSTSMVTRGNVPLSQCAPSVAAKHRQVSLAIRLGMP
jgi:IclR family pca regulon transcriptional regulator